MSSIISLPWRVVQQVAALGTNIKDVTSNADKTAKIANHSIKILQAAFQVSYEPIKLFSGQLRSFTDLLSGLNFINRVQELVTPGKGGLYRWQFWRKDPKTGKAQAEWGWQKTISRLCLTSAHGFASLGFLNSIHAIALGALAAPFTTAKNLLYIPASGFSIWDGALKLRGADDQAKKIQEKINKWEKRTEIAPLTLQKKYDDRLNNKLNKLGTTLQKGIKDTADKIAAAKPEEQKALQEKLDLMKVKQNRWTTYSEELRSGSSAQLEKDSKLKVAEYKKLLTTSKSNGKITKTSTWIGIASDTAKMATGIFCTIAGFFGVLGLVPYVISSSVGWLVADATGLAKELYSKYNPTTPVIDKVKLPMGV